MFEKCATPHEQLTEISGQQHKVSAFTLGSGSFRLVDDADNDLELEIHLVPHPERGEFQGVPSVMRIPNSILAPLETLRDNIHIHLEGGPYSLKDMQATMHKHRDELHGYHSSFDLHLEFLDNHANSVLERKALHLCVGVIIQVAHQ